LRIDAPMPLPTARPIATAERWWFLRPSAVISFFLHDERGRFLIAGGFNTAFAYGSFALLYRLFSNLVHYTVIVVASTIVNITFSFLTHKLYAFRSRGNWLRAYLRYYVVYAVPFVLGLGAFALCIEVFHLNAYVTQALIMAVSTVISYVGHKHFSFRKNRETTTAP
jgi:putative flippase GtrA